MQIDPNMSMDDVMRKWPASIAVLIRHRMHCVGCHIAPFRSIAEACRDHRIDEGNFLKGLERAIAGGPVSRVDARPASPDDERP
ncbi:MULTISPECIES: DUF1858 domain-containing protein [unclassified Mesorhizobium]|uniref:DUF1858 domain-containing protein n=1 Tax=unclassified Mesorhizobium TaxID=325217 RepID=UPI001FE0547E|nr:MULTISPECIES: DUF1858 domain-containing protein [unclassified Mesorhizobium]